MDDEKSKLSEKVPKELTRKSLSTVVVLDSAGKEVSRHEISKLEPNKYSLDVESFLPNVKPMTLDRFFGGVAQLLDRVQELEGVEAHTRVQLIEDHPPDPIADLGPTGEVITYKIISRKPGSNDPSGVGRIQRKSTFSYNLHSADAPNRVVVVESRPVDHVIEFSCWSKTNKAANHRVVWLEKLLIAHAWVFETHGAERFHWNERLIDNILLSGQQRLHQRPLRFHLRFREFEITSHPAIQTIDFDVSVKR